MQSAVQNLQLDHSPHDRQRRVITSLIVMLVMAMWTENMSIKEHKAYFDTDSKSIGINNRCSACISHDLNDFVGEVHKSDRVIKGFAGTRTTNVKKGTVLWKWEDDMGQVHEFLIPNSYYVPQGGCRLLSPQHWVKTQRDTKPKMGTKENNDGVDPLVQYADDSD